MRRRRVALAAASVLGAGAFAAGVTAGSDSTSGPDLASTLSAPQLAGERIVAGFAGTSVPPALIEDIRGGRVAGVILFADNLPSRAEARRLIERLQSIRRPAGLRDPLLMMVDQEGGQVKRVAGAPTASAREMGARGAAFSRSQGSRTARNLADIGFNVDLAPVLDVARAGGTIADTDRGFGSTPGRVAATAVPFSEALQEAGVLATAKHFPGLGAARANTDFAVQSIGLSRMELRRVDEAPYRSFIETGGEIVMLSTAIYPAFSPKPAAFARSIATGELRERLGFEGVSITDALGTVAVRDFGGAVAAGLAASRAGVDLLLFTDHRAAARTHRALARRLRSGTLDRAGFERSVQRVIDLRDELRAPAD